LTLSERPWSRFSRKRVRETREAGLVCAPESYAERGFDRKSDGAGGSREPPAAATTRQSALAGAAPAANGAGLDLRRWKGGQVTGKQGGFGGGGDGGGGGGRTDARENDAEEESNVDERLPP
jgi:hypothetical protein